MRDLASRSDVMIVSLFARERVASLAPRLPSLVLDLVIEPQSLEYLRSRLLEVGHEGQTGAAPVQPPLSLRTRQGGQNHA